MKTTAAAAMMMVALTVNAGESPRPYFADVKGYERIAARPVDRCYASTLKSENAGVVESALAHVTMMKLMLPSAHCPMVRAEVARIARTAASQETRYKAYLTGMVLDSADLFREVPVEGYAEPDALFGAVASRLAHLYAVR